MERYFLFRGDELIYSPPEDQLGAGHAYKYGQEHDVLICVRGTHIRGWTWNPQCSNTVGSQMAWLDIRPEKLEANKYRLLLLLQQ